MCSSCLQGPGLTCVKQCCLAFVGCCLHAGTVPASWGSAGSFPALSFLDLEDCQLTGTMPASWPPALQILTVPGNNFDGPLPVGLSQLAQLQQLSLDGNAFTGQLPPDWGNPEAFSSLFSLHCAETHLTGSLPPSWGSPTTLTGICIFVK